MPPAAEPPGTGPRPARSRLGGILVGLVPMVFLLLAFGRLVADPAALLVAADRPTVDRARVVDAPPGNDLTRQFLPLHRWIGAEWRRLGRLPTWDDRGFGGRPLVGNPQAGLSYPPVWLAWLVPAPSMLGWITLAHLAWGLLGVLRLGRTLGLGGPGRMVAAGCFALSPYLLGHVFEGHYPHAWAVSWYPWAFDALLRIGRGERRGGLQLVAALAATTLVGHPQEGYYLVVAGGLWAAIGAVARWRRGRVPWGRLGRRAGVAGGLFALLVALTAVETWPARQVAAFGLRVERPTSREAGQYRSSALNALQLLGPDALGGPHDYFGPDNYWETLLGVGLLPLALAGVGLSGGPDRRRVVGWAALVAGSVLFALGRQGGVFPLLFEVVPGMDRFRVPARSLFLAALGMAILAGFGADGLARRRDPAEGAGPTQRDGWRRWLGRWLGALALLGIAMAWGAARARERGLTPGGLAPTVAAAVGREARHEAGSDRDRVALALARIGRDPVFLLGSGALTAGLALGAWWPGGRRRVALAWGVLALAELAASGFRLLRTAPAPAFLAPGPAARALAEAGRGGPDRPRPVVRADAGVASDLEALALGLAKTDINDSFQLAHAARAYGRLYELSRPRPEDRDHPATGPLADARRRMQGAVLDRLGVAALAADRSTPRALALVAALGWPAATVPGAEGDRGPVVARSPDPLPWAYVVPAARAVGGGDERLVDEFAATDPRAAVLVDRDPLADVAAGRGRQAFRPAERVTLDGADRVEVAVTTEAPGLLVARQAWLPGWSATVDGRPAEVLRGNVAQQAIPLPDPGRHLVRLRYDAPGLRLGALISGGGCLAWLALWRAGRPRG